MGNYVFFLFMELLDKLFKIKHMHFHTFYCGFQRWFWGGLLLNKSKGKGNVICNNPVLFLIKHTGALTNYLNRGSEFLIKELNKSQMLITAVC